VLLGRVWVGSGVQKGASLACIVAPLFEGGKEMVIEAKRSGFLCGNKNIWHEALWHCWDAVRMSLLHVFSLELVSGRSL